MHLQFAPNENKKTMHKNVCMILLLFFSRARRLFSSYYYCLKFDRVNGYVLSAYGIYCMQAFEHSTHEKSTRFSKNHFDY